MDSNRVQEAIQLCKAGKKLEAEQILEPLVQSDPHNILAWMWLVEARPTVAEKLRNLETCARLNPGDETVRRALAAFQARLPSTPAGSPVPASAPVPVQAAPSHPPEEARSDDLVRFVVGQLGKHTGRSNLVQALCERSGMTWQEAESFVRKVEAEHRVQIAGRQAPLLLVLAGAVLLSGISLLIDVITSVLALPDPSNLVDLALYLRSNYYHIIEVPTGIAMVVGGIIGLTRIGKAFVTPRPEAN
jgi:hypothetical protein